MAILHNMISLLPEERLILIDLQDRAEDAIPRLKASLTVRLSKVLHNSPEHPELLSKAIAGWFTGLFYQFENANRSGPYKKPLVSVQLITACLDIILNFGQAITSTSTNPLLATEAFNKILAIRALERQLEESSNLNNLYEMCLLD